MTVNPVRQQHLVLPGVRPETVGPVRELVRCLLRLWDRNELGFVVELGVTELLTNVWRHTPGDCELLVRDLADGVMVAVTDFCAELPTLEAPADEAEAGRGLLLLSSLVDELDVLPLPCGKRISFQLNCTADTAQNCPRPAA
jgi:anti-sigma regulatory factor (Ser/Thr protein kinase)